MTARIPPLLLTVLGLSACVPEGDFPSLAMRPAELDRSMEAPVSPPVDVPADPALQRQVEALRGRAAEGDRAFGAAYGSTEATVRAAGPVGSDSWIEAQQAISRLEEMRAATMTALAELDRLALARIDRPTRESDLEAIDAAIAEVERLVRAQQARMDELRTRLAGD